MRYDENYKEIKLLGIGGGGATYLVAPVAGAFCGEYKQLAIKIVHISEEHKAGKTDEEIEPRRRSLQRALVNEGRKLTRIEHDNIVRCLDFDYFRGLLGMVMEYVPGETLSSFLSKLPETRLPIRKALAIIKQACVGLCAVHNEKLVHKDIKSSNLMVVNGRKIVIIDFGIAKDMQIGTGSIHAWTDGYAPPEQIAGEKSDHRVDIYSISVVLFEMVNGRRPFQSLEHDREKLLSAQYNYKLDPFKDDIPDELQKIILKALQPDPNERWDTMQEMVDALEKFEAAYEESMEEEFEAINNLIVHGNLDQAEGRIKSLECDEHPRLDDLLGQVQLYKARQIYEEGVKKFEDDGALHYHLGLVYLAQELWQDAQKQFELAELHCESDTVKKLAGYLAESIKRIPEDTSPPPEETPQPKTSPSRHEQPPIPSDTPIEPPSDTLIGKALELIRRKEFAEAKGVLIEATNQEGPYSTDMERDVIALDEEIAARKEELQKEYNAFNTLSKVLKKKLTTKSG